MSIKTEQLVKFFQKQEGILRFSTILKKGYHSDTLTSLEQEGIVEKIGHGLYKLSEYTIASHPDLVGACLQAPKGVVCLISALAFFEVTNEIPKAVDLAIPRGSRASKIKYPPVSFYQFTQKSWESGIEEHNIEGHTIKIYNLAKTIADCFKFRNKIGIDIARDALKTAITEKMVTPKTIMHYAKICRISNIIKPILESII